MGVCSEDGDAGRNIVAPRHRKHRISSGKDQFRRNIDRRQEGQDGVSCLYGVALRCTWVKCTWFYALCLRGGRLSEDAGFGDGEQLSEEPVSCLISALDSTAE